MKNVLAALVLLAAPSMAQADSPELLAALEAGDTGALQGFSDGETAEARMARGALAALRGEDEAALADLIAAGNDPALDPALIRQAWSNAAGIYLRQGRFAEAVDAFDAADAAAPEPDAAAATSAEQARNFARTASAAQPMQAIVAPFGAAQVTRDLAGLPRALALVNGAPQEAVLDTGANYSTIMASVAQQLGLRMLEGGISVGASGNDAVGGQIAIADSMSFAGADFTDVVFIVLPDQDLSFADGAYTIPAIIGLPVFARLGRVSFGREGDAEVLSHTASDAGWTDASNLIFRGLAPIVLVEANGYPMRMFIDSGATESHLTPRAVADYPALLEGAGAGSARIGGAGGEKVFEDATIIPALSVNIAGEVVGLSDIHVLGEAVDGRHGLIGQDILNAGNGYVIDFGARRFELLSKSTPSTE